jgi:hypothetical protein
MRTSKVQYKWHWVNLLLFQPTVALDVFKMDLRYTYLQKIMKTDFFVQVCYEWTILLLSQTRLARLDWLKFLVYIYLPHLFAQWAIVSMNLLQHDGCDVISTDNKTNTGFNTARNFTGTTINLLTFNNGFHTIHHMYPTMHWSRLRHEHNSKIQPHIHPNLDQPCMLSYIIATFVYPGKRVDYMGHAVKFTSSPFEPDEDWIREHAPADIMPHEYAIYTGIKNCFSTVSTVSKQPSSRGCTKQAGETVQ